MAKVESHVLADDGTFPNSRLPALIYRAATDGDRPKALERLFERNGWGDSWRDGIYDYVHYHSCIHEVLGIARGEGKVQFGGLKGRTGDGLRWKLEHGCFLTLPQISQQDQLPIGKFQRIMMRSRVVLVDLPEDGRRVINHSRLPRKQPSWPACYNPTKSKFCSRKNTNCRVEIFQSSEPCRTGIEMMRSQFLANIGRT
jgi:uncharacterized protein YjlB